jgi:uncharacterized protein (TIGR03435 family)
MATNRGAGCSLAPLRQARRHECWRSRHECLRHVAMAALLIPAALLAQEAKTPLRFEVCDIQVSKINDPQLMKADFLPGGRVDVRGMTLKIIIAAVNKLPENMVSGPDWMDSVRYDIVAKAVPTSSDDQLFEMARTMLTERFKMVSHTEKKTVSAYALVTGKKAITMTPAATSQARNAATDREVACPAVSGQAGMQHRQCHGLTMATLAQLLPQLAPAYFPDMQVVDMTGINGAFDFQLDWMGRALYNAAMNNTTGAAERPVSIFDAVDRLGLKLDSRKLPMDAIVVDSILRVPVEN